MRRNCLLSAAILTAIAAASTAAQDASVPEARAILEAWHAESPEPGDRRLHLICWRTRDRDQAADHQPRLDRIMTHIQAFYRAEMERHGLGSGTIRLNRGADGRLLLHEVVGQGGFADYAEKDGHRIRTECRTALRERGIDIDRETVMIFTNLCDWDARALTFRHKSPYYALGDHRRGTAWQLDSAELDTSNLPLREPLIADGQYGRISLGKHNSIFIGGIAHELGHALGLPHCRERPDEAVRGTALMGSGNRTYGDELRGEGKGTFLTLAHALRLASHPQFSGSVKGLHREADAAFSERTVAVAPDGRSFTFSGRVQASIPVYAVIGYLDPAGHGNYDAHTVSAVPDALGRFALACLPLVPGKSGELAVVACHANGATSRLSYPYAVAKEGRVDIGTMEVMVGLEPFWDAVSRRDFDVAARFRDQLPESGRSRRIATSILAGIREPRLAMDSPAATGAAKMALSHLEPAEARVGWLRPAYDHLPRRDGAIIVAGEVFETGIYAHAPATHRYRLGGRWNRLSGRCGIPDGGGSVVFTIRTDGREVFRSPRIEPGRLERYAVDLKDVDALELVTEDAGDGRNADWGVWVEPTLFRTP